MLRDTPSGDSEMVTFELWNQTFMAISAGPLFKFNPSASFMVNFDPLLFGSSSTPEKDAREKLDMLWNKLAEGGTVLLPIDKYPFSERYGWLQDKYGLSWQIVPRALGELMADKDPVKANRVMQAMLKMTKLDIKKLDEAYAG